MLINTLDQFLRYFYQENYQVIGDAGDHTPSHLYIYVGAEVEEVLGVY